MKSFKGGMQDRNLGPLLPDDFFFFRLTLNKKLREISIINLNNLSVNIYIISINIKIFYFK